jgi:hypothetical protein
MPKEPVKFAPAGREPGYVRIRMLIKNGARSNPNVVSAFKFPHQTIRFDTTKLRHGEYLGDSAMNQLWSNISYYR